MADRPGQVPPVFEDRIQSDETLASAPPKGGALNVLGTLLHIEPRSAGLIYAGVGLFAGVAMIKTLGFSPVASGLMGVYLLGLGALVIIVATVVHDAVMARVLGWFLTLLIMFTTSAFVISSLFRNSGPLKPSYCLVQFWGNCPTIERDVTSRLPTSEPVVQPRQFPSASVAVSVNPGEAPLPKPPIYIQFSGLISDRSVEELNASLRLKGWNVQGSKGERTDAARGLNEVRYGFDDLEPAARLLANAITDSRITNSKVSIRKMNTPRRNLEVWISS